MWKDKIGRAGVAEAYCVYKIEGVNLDAFINAVKKSGITLYNAKKQGGKRLIVSVKFKESAKFFAIANKMCYNIKKIAEKGRDYPLIAVYRRLGLLLGAILFVAVACVFNDFILDFSFSGSARFYHREVEEFLLDEGVRRFSRFSSIDLQRLEDKLLSSNKSLSFVAMKKEGNRLCVNLQLSQKPVDRLQFKTYALISDCEGVVEKVSVYRGSAKVKEGDEINFGDLLVEGVAEIKEQTVKINVLASVSVICSDQLVYYSKDEDGSGAEVLATQRYVGFDVVDCSVITEQSEGGYLHRVIINYRRVLRAG